MSLSVTAPSEPERAGAWLTIDLDAICANWADLRARLAPGAACAAVVKADAYGLGAAQVAPSLAAAGCRHFFVAHLAEGMALRPHLPSDVEVYVLHGIPPGCAADFVACRLIPVLNAPDQVAAWVREARRVARPLPAVLQVDTGMARLGLDPAEARAVAADPAVAAAIPWRYLMSHLACAEESAHPANRAQRAAFEAVRAHFPGVAASLANSSGIFLGADYHYALARPGAALYGVAPVSGQPNPQRPVIRLRARVIQTRTVPAGTGVGYGHTWRAPGPARLATLAIGYADGYLRSLSNRGVVWHAGQELPIVGNVSMDTVVVDVSRLPEGGLMPGDAVDVIDPCQPVDAVAGRAGTIAYEILTSLGQRYARSYTGVSPLRRRLDRIGERPCPAGAGALPAQPGVTA